MNTIVLEIVISLLVSAGLSCLLIFELAKKDIYFTLLETGDVKFVEHGQKLYRILYDVPGFKLNANNIFVALASNEKDARRSRSFFGIYWLGPWPFARIHKFKIVKQSENLNGKNMSDWIITKGEEDVSSLRFNFPRPYTFPNVELGDEDPIAVNILAVAKFEVVDPIKMIYRLKGKFFENAGGILNAEIADTLNNLTFAQFVDMDKGETGEMSDTMKAHENTPDGGKLNKALVHQVGLRLVGIAMQYDPANEDLRKAMEAKTIAVAKGSARKAEAAAEEEALKNLARGKAAEAKELSEALNAAHENTRQGVTDILTARAQPNATVVKGAVSVTLPGGGTK